MSEDITGRLPDRPEGYAELLRLIQSFRAELAELKQTVDARLHDTRPIWEKVQADITLLQEGQQRLEEKLEALRLDTGAGLRNLGRQFGTLHETFLGVRADFNDLDKRVFRLEEPRP